MVEYDAQLETSTPAHLFCTIIELAFHCYELFVKWSLLTVGFKSSRQHGLSVGCFCKQLLIQFC